MQTPMKKLLTVSLLLVTLVPLFGQGIYLGPARKMRSGTAPPANCNIGDIFFDTDATAGQNFYGCTALNTWTAQGGGGTVVASGTTGQVVVFTGSATAGGSTSLTATNGLQVNSTLGSEQAPALTSGNWTGGGSGGWASITGGVLQKNGDGTGTMTTTAATTIVAGTTYKVTITCSAASVGSATYTIGASTGPSTICAAATTYTDYVTTTTTGKIIITPTNTSRFTISVVSILPLTSSTADLTVQGFTALPTLFTGAHTQNQGGTYYGLPYLDANGRLATDPTFGYVPCSDTANCSSGGALIIGNATNGSSSATKIVLGNSAVGGAQIQLNAGSDSRIFVRGSADFLLGSNAVGLFTEIDGTSGIKLTPAAGTTVQTSAHIVATGTINTIASGFGTGAAVETGSNDMSGRIGVGTTPGLTGVINFITTWSRAPACSASDGNTVLAVSALASTTTLTLTSGSNWTNNDNITWQCLGH